jgi:hypothetical protein
LKTSNHTPLQRRGNTPPSGGRNDDFYKNILIPTGEKNGKVDVNTK